jgi:hypothetical protein
MKLLTVAGLIGCLIHIHSWYPYECCQDEHCYPVEWLRDLKNGDTVVKTGDDLEVTIPKGFPRRSSEDGKYHLCYDRGSFRLYHELHLYCFFVPGEA